MRRHFSSLAKPVLAACLLLSAVRGFAAAEEPKLRPLAPGAAFPAARFSNLNAAAGGPAEIDLADYLGKKPIVFHYWIAMNTRSEEVFKEVEKLVAELGGAERVALFGVAVPRPGVDEATIKKRLAELGVKVPVLNDLTFGVGRQLQVGAVPNITILDRAGKLRLSNGASLTQVLGYQMDVARAIRRVAETGDLMNYGYLQAYFPVKELEGAPSPDFSAPGLQDSAERQWHDLLDKSKVNVLIFWSVDCPHCRRSLPEINTWLKQHPDGVNVVSCAAVSSEETRTKTAEFCRHNDFQFQTLLDRDAKIGDLYKVTSTPTILIIGPNGVVDRAIVSGHTDFGKAIEERKQRLLGAGSS